MALTNDHTLMVRMARLRSHGITRDVMEMTAEPDGPWYYQQLELGFNYRMTDIQAALGISQMQRLDSFVLARHKLASSYEDLMSSLPVISQFQHSDGYSSYHLYTVRLQLEKLDCSHKQVFERMRGAGIGVNLHYIPIYRQPYYEKQGFSPNDFPEAERYYKESISLPMFPGLDYAQQLEVVNCIIKPAGYQTIF